MFVCWLLNVLVVFNCLQHIFPTFDLHGVHLSSFKGFKSFLILPLSTQCVPIISWMFLFRLNALTGSFFKISLKFSFICKIFQFFLMVLVIFGRNRLYVIKRGILFDFCRVSLSVMRSILLSRLVIWRCSLINDGWLLFKSTWFELIRLIRMTWL